MRLTQRDEDIVLLAARLRVVRDDQVQIALFTPGGASRCQRRLTLLVSKHYLDRLPRERANDPAIYTLTRRSFDGMRLLRERVGEEQAKRLLAPIGPLRHQLAVNDVRVRVERGCRDLKWQLFVWQRSQDLGPFMSTAQLVPDAYFQVRRVVDGVPKASGFFLEVERAGKSSRVLRSKLERYVRFYRDGEYSRVFGIRGMRVLVVFESETGGGVTERIKAAALQARDTGATFARLADATEVRACGAVELLTTPIWFAPDGPVRCALL